MEENAVWELTIRVQTTLDPARYDLSGILAHAEVGDSAGIVGYDCRLIAPEDVDESVRDELGLGEGGEDEEGQ